MSELHAVALEVKDLKALQNMKDVKVVATFGLNPVGNNIVTIRATHDTIKRLSRNDNIIRIESYQLS